MVARTLAAGALTLAALTTLPALAEQTILSQPGLPEPTGRADWADISAEDGDGVTFAQLQKFTAAALAARGMDHARDSFRPTADEVATLDALRALLAANEASAGDAAPGTRRSGCAGRRIRRHRADRSARVTPITAS